MLYSLCLSISINFRIRWGKNLSPRSQYPPENGYHERDIKNSFNKHRRRAELSDQNDKPESLLVCHTWVVVRKKLLGTYGDIISELLRYYPTSYTLALNLLKTHNNCYIIKEFYIITFLAFTRYAVLVKLAYNSTVDTGHSL